VTTYDRYLLRRFIHVFLVLFVTTFGLYVIIDCFTNVDGFQENRDGTWEVLSWIARYYSYQSVVFFGMVAPILSVVSVVVVLAMLVKRGELQPVLAAGVPTYRLAVPFLIGVMLVEAGLIANQEIVIPSIAQHLRSTKKGESSGHSVESVYDHKTYVHITGAELFTDDERMTNAEFTLPFPHIARELTTMHAVKATFHEADSTHPAGWLLHDVQPRFDQLALSSEQKIVLGVKKPQDVFVVTDISFDQLYNSSHTYRFASTPELIRRIRNPSFGTATITGQVLHLHTRLTAPLLSVIGVFVVLPLIVRRESRSLVTSMALCTGVLALLMGVGQLCLYFGSVNLVSTSLAAWMPVIFNGSCGAWLTGTVQT
jgi:lipopolysaccharide export system permease protein